ncbi:poly(3-hydroxyalkanoate) synthetase, partial [Alsobacter soli]
MAVAKRSATDRPAAPEPLVRAKGGEPAFGAEDLLAYWLDAGQRAVLFLDALRQRAENIVAHERAGKPPLLDFDFEVVAEARRFERPTNYSLLRITRVGEDCLGDCLQPGLRPVVVFDPRAGHGPGIGGFKRESEVGLALRAGHPTYFVSFAPEPVAGQTLHDVLRTLRRFLEEVGHRHPGQPPVLYGNCQAGWAITMLAADCQGLVGTAVLNGSPLSYWAGEPGVNPMRTAAGFTGGMWTAHLLSDLDDGRFDGAWLVQNFEALKPEGVWSKYADLFERVRAERERFLEFERWWNGFYMLGREEILAITENLFVGNRLEQGLVWLCQHCKVDLRRIRNPLV